MMKHKGYVGRVEYDDEAGIFHGEVVNTRDVITFQGATVAELRKAFRDESSRVGAILAEFIKFPRVRSPSTLAAWLVVGAACGWLAGKFMEEATYGIKGDLFLGALGAFIGGCVYGLLGAGARVQL